MRVILDTNVLVSALLVAGSIPARIVDASSDPADNFLLAMAQTVSAEYLVTSDKRGLLALKRHGVTRIVSAGRFIEILERP
jgi:predicted nucleic acid-binding protein